METVRKTCTGLDITSPDHSVSYIIHIIGLVDEKRLYATYLKDNSEQNVCKNL